MFTDDQIWQAPPTVSVLELEAVHVWRVSLNCSPSQLNALRHVLSVDETDRADKFHFPRDRRRYIVGRAHLRFILSRYLRTDPSKIQFGYSAYGKPFLISSSNQVDISFNVSHSDELALYVLTLSREIGVDVELIRQQVEYNQIVARFFSPLERALFHALPVKLRAKAFFACWTRKEAYIKAQGAGLSLPLDSFAVSLTPGDQAQLLYVEGKPDEAALWSFQEISVGNEYQAALAVYGRGLRLSWWNGHDLILEQLG